ncbi:BcsR/BcsP family cellulose biosynthesis protein [Pseudomonas sp. sp1636]|uniref:BcsR/BcsP family cellulose biosynthesis protein n=1 Tax=Pseudomonas sp. sp1636 TaxID=3036707 RepID=UPI0025A66D15|nr:BcsR/BcsP family cellulose biosynthesis protein [Pseudomonas sp. sp1636]MDM8349907.1 BcsR/BcsP family cellulose biosynthesis protein [Pseudomonas sp. sp1636]
MDFQPAEVDRPALQSQEDLSFLLEHYQLKAFHYSELQHEQAVLAAVADWPLLNETLRPLLQVIETVNLVKAD